MGLRGGGINLGLKPKSFSLALLENCLEEGILEMVLWALDDSQGDKTGNSEGRCGSYGNLAGLPHLDEWILVWWTQQRSPLASF